MRLRKRLFYPFPAVAVLLFQPSYSASAAVKKNSKLAVDSRAFVRCITPGINSDNIVEIKKPIRVLFQEPGQPADPGYTGKAEFINSAAEKIVVNGKPVIAFVATYNAPEDTTRIGGQVVVLALFKMRAGKPVLIDAVDVSTDKFCGFSNDPILHYKAGTDAVIIENSHFNSSENYCALTVIAPIHNRLIELCHDVPVLYNAKAASTSMVEEGRIFVGKGIGASSRPMFMSIKVICKKFDADDGDKVLSTNQKTFIVPFLSHGETYSVNPKNKALIELNTFVKKNGFDAP